MEILHWGIQKCHHECSLGVNLVIDHFVYVVSDTSPLYTIWRQSDHYLRRYCILKIWGYKSVINECSLGVNLVIDNFLYVASDTSPLYKIWKQSYHYLWRYCILKCHLTANAVVLVLGEYQISISTYLKIWKISVEYFLT